MKNILLGISFFVLLSACSKKNDPQIETGMKPVYTSLENFDVIASEPARAFTAVGKIFKIGNRIFISDKGSGVHVIDNSNPASPQKEAFVSIMGNNDMAVKQNIMYADNGADLVVLDITDVNNVVLGTRIENVYDLNAQNFPPNHIGFFECVDPEKGYVYDWISAELNNPNCNR